MELLPRGARLGGGLLSQVHTSLCAALVFRRCLALSSGRRYLEQNSSLGPIVAMICKL